MKVTQEMIDDPLRPGPAPKEYAGLWVAWDETRKKVLAHARTIAELDEIVTAMGLEDPIFERVRRLNERLIGRT
jgi:hypothetical protein